jgi:hypothetical protein
MSSSHWLTDGAWRLVNLETYLKIYAADLRSSFCDKNGRVWLRGIRDAREDFRFEDDGVAILVPSLCCAPLAFFLRRTVGFSMMLSDRGLNSYRYSLGLEEVLLHGIHLGWRGNKKYGGARGNLIRVDIAS